MMRASGVELPRADGDLMLPAAPSPSEIRPDPTLRRSPLPEKTAPNRNLERAAQ